MLIPFFAGVILITAFDQIIKAVAAEKLMQIGTIPLIDNVFHLTYCENPGAGFGIFADYTWILSVLTFLVIAAAVVYVAVKRPKNALLMTALTFMVGGAVGNLIDRVRLGYVIDFFDFRLIHFPIFNIADCFVTIGAVIFAVYVIFFSDKKEQADGQNKG